MRLFSVNTTELPIAGALWFLTALFITDVGYTIIVRYCKCRSMFHIIVAIIVLSGHIVSIRFHNYVPYALDVAMVGIGLYHVGRCFKEIFNTIKDVFLSRTHTILPLILLVGGGSIISILIMLNGKVNMREGKYDSIPLFWLNSCGMSVLGLIVCEMVYMKTGSIGKILAYLGRNAMTFVCLNQIIILFLQKLIVILYLPPLVNSVIILMLSIVLLSIVDIAINKTNFKFIIGK